MDNIDTIIESLEGAFKRGHNYLIKTVTYHYFGVVNSIGNVGPHYYVVLERVVGIGAAGSADDATVQIVTGKAKPSNFEVFPPNHLVRIWVHAITEDQEVKDYIKVR